MKRRLAILLTLVLLVGIVAMMPVLAEAKDASAPPPPPHIKDGVDVTAIFANGLAQPLPLPKRPDGEETQAMADTMWIYYSDNTFDQYVEGPAGYELFSTGTYSFKDGGSFNINENEDNGVIVIERNKKMSPETRALEDYASSHEYALGTLGFTQLYGPKDEGKEVEAIFGQDHMLRYTNDSGVTTLVDTFMIFFRDMSFKVYSFIEDEVTLTGSGTYAFDEAGDFTILPFEEDNGTITMNFDYSLETSEPVSVVFDLEPLATNCFYMQRTEEMPEF